MQPPSPRSVRRALGRRLRRYADAVPAADQPPSPAPAPPTTAVDERIAELQATVDRLRRENRDARRDIVDHAVAYRMLASAPDGLGFNHVGPPDLTAPTRDEAAEMRQRILTMREKASFFDALARGAPIEQAITEYVREYVGALSNAEMRMLCEALRTDPATEVAGELGWAVVVRFFALPQKSWYHFSRVPEDEWRRWAPAEYFDTARELGAEYVVDAATRLIDDRPDDLPAESWLAAVRAAIGIGRTDIARQALEFAESAMLRRGSPSEDTSADVAWLTEWLGRLDRVTPSAPIDPPQAIAFGVLDYKQPDRLHSSTNVGDFLQTLAALGHLVRHRDVTLAGPDDLVEVVGSLQQRVVDTKRIAGPARQVTLVPVNRDASSADELPDPTWLVAFGWYMHETFGSYDFPFHPNIRPLFVSFHCNQPRMLTPEAIDYLRRYGPVGCRDWNTVYLLHGLGVPAFFSGCITTTIDTVGPVRSPADPPSRPVAFVDRPAPPWRKGVRLTHALEASRRTPLAGCLDEALRRLDAYRGDYSRIITSRLHCYLPARAVGATVEFVPWNPADIRFNGLAGIDDEAFDAIRSRINDRLASTLSLVLAGGPEAAVYEHWRSVCAADVEAAEQRIAGRPALPPPSFDVSTACARIRSEQFDAEPSVVGASGPAVDVTVALDGNLTFQLGVVVEALRTFSTRPLHLWILCRDHGPAQFDRLAREFPDVTFSWLPCDHIDYGEVAGIPPHITPTTLDRLLLPELLGELDRIVYLDIDLLPQADIAELADWDLRGAPLAARAVSSIRTDSGYGANIFPTARRQRAQPALGDDLLCRMARKHPYDFTSFNAGVLVLDLARMRGDRFCHHFLPFVEIYGMNDQEVLNAYVGPERADLPAEWNHIPSHEHIEIPPKLIHWLGRVKPWEYSTAPRSDVWRKFAAAYERRAADARTTLAR